MTKQHAKLRPPSAADRWLSCPASAEVVGMYPNEPTEASLKGDYAHDVMEDTITFGCVAKNVEPDMAEGMEDLLAYVQRRMGEMGAGTRIFVEVTLQIPETGEFGTVDILLVGPKEIEVIDHKSGYIPVTVKMNGQMLVYLCGAIALHGVRPKYKITIHQPNYDHIDGAIRSYDVSTDEVEWLRNEIRYSMENSDRYAAGKHCKKTYCPHRGTCIAFAEYSRGELLKGWHTSEVKGVSDEYLSQALDASDELSGYRNELRAEAMRRIMNMDRTIHGYKVVKGRRDRAVINALKLIDAVSEQLGAEWACKLFPKLDFIHEKTLGAMLMTQGVIEHLGTPKHIEDVIKAYAREYNLERGGWKKIYDNVVGEYIRETVGGLTLEKAIDGRPAHRRGSEFGALLSPGQGVNII